MDNIKYRRWNKRDELAIQMAIADYGRFIDNEKIIRPVNLNLDEHAKKMEAIQELTKDMYGNRGCFMIMVNGTHMIATEICSSLYSTKTKVVEMEGLLK